MPAQALTLMLAGCCMAQLPQVWPRGYMVAMDLGPEARYKDVRCVKYERSASKVNRVLYIPYYYQYL